MIPMTSNFNDAIGISKFKSVIDVIKEVCQFYDSHHISLSVSIRSLFFKNKF